MHGLSHLVITKNSGELLEESFRSTRGLVDEIVVVDGGSTDATLDIARTYGAHIFEKKGEDLGGQRSFGLSKCRGPWVLMLDADEVVSPALKSEILRLSLNSQEHSGFRIPYQNHFLGKPLHYGGEDYDVLRLFRKDRTRIPRNLIHEHAQVKGKIGRLNSKICHYSYRSLGQTFAKFTDYARREAARKLENGEHTSIGKLFLYPAHMFFARYVKDRGYRDFPLRIFLDIAFAYMEFLTYLFMFFRPEIHKEA